MHEVAIRPEIIERVLARRGRLHLYDRLDARHTALVVIDMQNAFVASGAPIEVPGALAAGSELQRLWPELTVQASDVVVTKNRYSALIPGASSLADVLRAKGIDTLLIAGTKTNVCCECTARDAMMLDYQVVLLSDCTAALSHDEHRATLENVIQQFGDVMTADQALALLV